MFKSHATFDECAAYVCYIRYVTTNAISGGGCSCNAGDLFIASSGVFS